MASTLTEQQRTRALNDLRRAKQTTAEALKDLIERNPRHPGTALLKPPAQATNAPTRSELEDLFLSVIRRYELPVPQINAPLDGDEVDALFAAEKLIVELDSWRFHGHRQAFADDRRRDADRAELGYLTLRITQERLRDHPGREAARISRILELRNPTSPRGH